ncbi:MAG: hypothetical protein SFW36_02665 [Leptolyngbyaceae cyanobacterium bins.59]|nr:hypothetical protein [Leptolyngbyaceae cyanobacterium bins.59]
MYKSFALALVSALLVIGTGERLQPSIAGTCASNCGPKPLQFTPGQPVTIRIANRTASLVLIQRIQGTDPIPLQPGQELEFDRWGGTKPNLSMVFWDQISLPLLARASRTGKQSFRLEILPGGRPPGDRAVYIRDDGRVVVF